MNVQNIQISHKAACLEDIECNWNPTRTQQMHSFVIAWSKIKSNVRQKVGRGFQRFLMCIICFGPVKTVMATGTVLMQHTALCRTTFESTIWLITEVDDQIGLQRTCEGPGRGLPIRIKEVVSLLLPEIIISIILYNFQHLNRANQVREQSRGRQAPPPPPPEHAVV